MKISTHPLITALSAEYAREIKALKEDHEAKIEALYLEFHQKYQCLKRTIEVLEDDGADRMDSSSAPSTRISCRATNNYE